MKNKKRLIIVLLLLLLTTGCTKQLVDSNNKPVKNEKTGQTLTENIICKPTNEETYNIYENRFLYTLIKQVESFLFKREEELKKLGLTDETSIDNMIWPFPGDPNIYSYFGSRINPISKEREIHNGIDIGGDYGSDIVASLAGKVIKASWGPSNGNYIALDHGNGVVTYYLHASKLLVKEGEYVKQGQVIMKCGSTGWSTAPHLHFTIRINGALVDPCDYVRP